MSAVNFELIASNDTRHLTLENMVVHLKWSANVDLDLMAFYETKNGVVGAVYSNHYHNGDMGSLDRFPFMQLSPDAGFKNGQRQDKVEEIKISKFDDIKYLYLVAVNFSSAANNQEQKFSSYDAMIEISSHHKDEAQKTSNFKLLLDSSAPGNVALFAKIENTNTLMGALLRNVNEVLTFQEFQKRVPGSQSLNLKSKVILREKGQKALVANVDSKVQATLSWKTKVDFDLHCFYRTKKVENAGFFTRLFSNTEAQEGHIYFRNKGDLADFPHIQLDKDSGIGDKGGDNQENIFFGQLSCVDRLLIAVNTFNKPNSCFANYDAKVTLHLGHQEIIVPLTEKAPGAWCVIAELINDKDGVYLVNINQTQKDEPSLA